MASNDEIRDLKVRQNLADQFFDKYKDVDRRIIEEIIDLNFDLYDQLDELISTYSPRKFHYFVHEKKGVVRVLSPKDPEFMKTQYLPGDDTPMVPETFDYVKWRYPSQIEYILSHPRAHRAPEGPGRKTD